MNYNDLIEFLLKFQARLTLNDQQRLHAYIGENIIERIEQDSSLRTHLSLISFLCDREDNNEEDMQKLINTCNIIQCTDYAQHLKQNIKRIKFRDGNSVPLLPMNSSRNAKPFSTIVDGKGRTSILPKPRKGWSKMLTSRTLSLLVIVRSLILIAIFFGGCYLILRLHIRSKHEKENSISNQSMNSTSMMTTEKLSLPCDCQEWCTDGRSSIGRDCDDNSKCICNEY